MSAVKKRRIMKGKNTDKPIPVEVISIEVQPQIELSGLVFEVNPRQYKRILKRRKEREIVEKRYAENNPKAYQHESRHKHAMKRPRSKKGRFLTKKEIEALDSSKKEKEEDSDKAPDRNTTTSKQVDKAKVKGDKAKEK